MSHPPTKPPDKSQVWKPLQEEGQNRERYEPRPGDGLYLQASDLRIVLEKFRNEAPITVLDYGCGGSPYRGLFPNATYLRADFGDEPDLNYQTKEGLLPDAPDQICDVLLSTQVLEHTEHPDRYLAECYRLLKPGGKLICSTHGMFPDHCVPYDFHRWTAVGFRKACEQAGFIVDNVYRLTGGPRAIVTLLDLHYSEFQGPANTAFGFFLMICRNFYGKIRLRLHWQMDKFFPNYRVLNEGDEGSPTYICVLADCRKPA